MLGDKIPTKLTSAPTEIYREDDLTEKERRIYNYIKDNPGTTKQGVINSLGHYSRVPILNTINWLVKSGLVIIKIDELIPNTTIFQLMIIMILLY